MYGPGCYSRQAPIEMVRRARLAGVPIESNRAMGYRLGRDRSLICSSCGSLRVRYPDGEVVCYGCVGTEYAELEVGRAPYDPNTRQGRAWTEEESALLRELWQTRMTQAEIAMRLERTANSVRAQGKILGLGRKPYGMEVRE